MDELVERLRKAGIDARLVHRVQDELTIDLETCTEEMLDALSKGCSLLPASEEFKGFEVGVISDFRQIRRLLPKIPVPVFMDYPAPTKGSDISDEKLKNFVEEIQKVYLEDSHNRTVSDDIFDALRFTSGKPTMDSND